VPEGARVATCPVAEAHGGVWFWPGSAERADPALIPDFGFIDTGAPVDRSHYVMAVNYELIADNLLDLSHAEFLHVESFGTNGSLFSHGAQTVETDDTGAVWNKWDMTGAPPPGWAMPMVGEGGRVDQQLHIRWHAPANLALFIRMALSGAADPLVPPMANPHILTPETENSTHYFFTHEPGPEAEAMARRVFLEEDEPMISAQAEAMAGADFWEMKPLILASDRAAILARRKLMQMRNSEAS
jgi:vanillate O-demethylase monooxygenase subunit